MPYVQAKDGTRLFYEEAGQGTPIIFVHEFAGDHRSWEAQLRHFARHYRAIAYSARGYPPSEVPPAIASYSQTHARDDVIAVLDHLGIDKAHVVGLSMGGFATLHVGLHYPARCRSLVVAGCGYGAEPNKREQFRAEVDEAAKMFETEGAEVAARRYASSPARVQFENKDPRGYREFVRQLSEHSTAGSALTLRGVQRERPSLWDLIDDIKRIAIPTLIVTGDEDESCLEPALMLKRAIATSGLVVLPKCGHTINLEDPDTFNRALGDFLAAVELGRWGARDPRALAGSIMGFGRA